MKLCDIAYSHHRAKLEMVKSLTGNVKNLARMARTARPCQCAHGSTGSETLNILRQRLRADASEWKNYVAH